jgi:hypothetical protein
MSSPDDAAALRRELEEVRRREAEYRVKMIAEFLDRGERNTYLHTLHQEQASLTKRVQEASGDIEILTRKLEAAEARVSGLEAEQAAVRASLSWKLTAPLRAIGRAVGMGRALPGRPSQGAAAEGAPFTYYLHTSPFRVYREPTFTLRGWAWPEDGRAVTGIRANLGGRRFPGRVGIEEPEVIARYGPQPANPRPGFEVTFETPRGRHQLSLEAELAGSEWRTIVSTAIWSEASG